MRTISTLISFLLFLLSLIESSSSAVIQSSQEADDTNNSQVNEAIKICREKLAVDPNFPRVQLSLAKLLDSKIDWTRPSKEEVVETIELYISVAKPHPATESSRLPPLSVQFDSLCRAAALCDEVLHDSSNAIRYYLEAIQMDNIDCDSTISIFERLMPLILASVKSNSIEGDNSSVSHRSTEVLNQKLLQQSLDLCDLVSSKCEENPISDEFRGVTLRKLKQPSLAFESYNIAATKSKDLVESNTPTPDEESMYRHLELIRNYVRRSILASAAAREDGRGYGEQLSFLVNASSSIGLLLQEVSADGNKIHPSILGMGKDVVVDLYNNIGITEKKRGNASKAAEYFMKALEIKPSDSHAQVQLASLKVNDPKSVEIIADVTTIDADYVSGLFDGYSSRFEKELVDVLNYKGHTLVYDAIMKEMKTSAAAKESVQSIVDLGCGSGLLGELFRNKFPSANIVGVDLSQRMTDIARDRLTEKGQQIYTSIYKSDAMNYLSSINGEEINCIVASDVFIYIGDIEMLLAEAKKNLSGSGMVGFTIESYEDIDPKEKATSGLKLLPSGRFGHSQAYIKNVAEKSGFRVSLWESCVLRKQGSDDVDGAVVILKLK